MLKTDDLMTHPMYERLREELERTSMRLEESKE